MFTMIDNPCRPWPTLWGFGVLAAVLGSVIFFQMYWPLALKIEPPLLKIADFRVTPLVPTPKFKAVRAGGKHTARAAQSAGRRAENSTASATPGTAQWGRYVERGHGLDFPIVAEQSLPVLRAYGVPLAMASQRPRGNALLYDIRTCRLFPGAVAESAVVREVEGLPAEFDGDTWRLLAGCSPATAFTYRLAEQLRHVYVRSL